MSRIKIRQDIQIERNSIEQFLMNVKELLKANKRIVLISLAFLGVASVVLISVLVYREIAMDENLTTYERILDKYGKAASSGDRTGMDKATGELKKFIDASYFGSSRELACYTLGNIYFSDKKYPEARTYLLRYADKASSSSTLIPLALFKAAIAAEEAKDLDGAIGIFNRLEEKYGSSIVAEQAYYNMARVYVKKKDVLSAKRYYNKVIVSYPESPYKEKAARQLFLLGGEN